MSDDGKITVRTESKWTLFLSGNDVSISFDSRAEAEHLFNQLGDTRVLRTLLDQFSAAADHK